MAERKVQITFTGMDRVSAVAAKVGRNMKGLGKVAQGLKGIGAAAAGAAASARGALGPVGAIAGIGAGFGFGNAIGNFAKVGDEVAKLSKQLNFSVEGFQELRFWADRYGISNEKLSEGSRQLNSRLAQAASGQNDKLAAKLASLGIALRDANGEMRNTDDIMQDLAETFPKLRDDAARTTVANALFGEEAGAKFAAALNEGSDAMSRRRQEARDLGLVLSEEQAKLAETLTDKFTNISAVVSGLSLQFAASLAPAVIPVIESLTQSLSAMNTEENQAGIKAFGENIVAVVDFIGGWDVALGGIVALVSGPFIVSMATAAASIAKVGAAFLANPIGLAVAGIAAAAFLIYDNWETVGPWFERMWGNIKDIFGGVVDVIGGLIGLAVAGIAGAVYLIYDNWDGVVRWFSDLWGNVGSVFGGAVDAIKGILTGDSQLAVDGFLAVFDGLAGLVENNWDLVTGVISKALSGIDSLLGTDLQASFYRTITYIENLILALPEKFLLAVKDIGKGFKDLGRSALEFVPDLSFSSLNPFSDDDEDEAAARAGSGGAASALAGGIPDAPPGAVLAAAASTGAAGGVPGTANDGDVGVNVEIKATSVESVSATTTGRGRYSRVMGFSPAGVSGY